jgi:CheY-like chemotaxis protein
VDGRRLRDLSTRPLVLIVEGHEDTRVMYTFALSALGLDVVAVEDGAEAYRRACAIEPDVIVTDLPTPIYEDWPFLHDLKRNPRTRRIPVVVLSGYMPHVGGTHAERDGFAAVFLKPCLPDQLAAGLRHVVERTHLGSPGVDGGAIECPTCGQKTVGFTTHHPVLTDVTALTRTGTDPHDGRERLRYRRAWVCQNPHCNYRYVTEDSEGGTG